MDGLGWHHSIATLGAVLLVRSVCSLLEGVQSLARYAHHRNPHGGSRIARLAHSFVFDLIAGCLILVACIYELYEAVAKEEETTELWHFGFLLLGASLVARAVTAFRKVLRSLPHYLNKKEHSLFERFAPRLERFGHILSSPRVEVFLGLSFFGIGALELLFMDGGHQPNAEPHHALLAIGATHLLKFVPLVIEGVGVVGEGITIVESAEALIETESLANKSAESAERAARTQSYERSDNY